VTDRKAKQRGGVGQCHGKEAAGRCCGDVEKKEKERHRPHPTSTNTNEGQEKPTLPWAKGVGGEIESLINKREVRSKELKNKREKGGGSMGRKLRLVHG